MNNDGGNNEMADGTDLGPQISGLGGGHRHVKVLTKNRPALVLSLVLTLFFISEVST